MTEIVLLTEFVGPILPDMGRMRVRGMRLALRWRTGLDLLSRFCAENMVSLVDLQAGPRSGKHQSIVALRRQFCALAKGEGIGAIYIGRLLNLDHSTVTYHVNPRYRARKRTKREKYDRNRIRKPRSDSSGQDQGAGAVDTGRDPAG